MLSVLFFFFYIVKQFRKRFTEISARTAWGRGLKNKPKKAPFNKFHVETKTNNEWILKLEGQLDGTDLCQGIFCMCGYISKSIRIM